MNTGMADSRSYMHNLHYPLNTCKLKNYSELCERVVKKFSKSLYEEEFKVGQLSNIRLDSYSGFKLDLTYAGEEMRRMLDIELWQ